MITKIYLSPNDEQKPVIFSWDDRLEDYVIEQIPNGLSRLEINDLVKELNRITRFEE